ncbi:MAG: carbon monoxide dehydrogenase [Thiohalocapsa sp.]|nr:carbon monoxide dehydrogenase [Thiohalocapsa sp.]
MSDGRQRQRHGVAKNLAEGIGGLVVGAALVVMIRSALKHRRGRAASAPAEHLSPTAPSGNEQESPS